MKIPDNLVSEAKVIISEYVNLEKQTANLLEQTNLLTQRKKQIELELAEIREHERSLIDKIERETGESLNLFDLLQRINS